jgi:hypothetical protein
MSGSSDSGSEGLPYDSRTVSSEPAGPPATPETAELLENVLRKTLSVCTSDEPLDKAEMQRFLEVARRHREQPLSADPVVRELVLAALEGHFAGERGEDFWQATAAQIAQTLLDDPVARPRLERFWGRLCEETS